MKISYNWLKQYLDFDLTPGELSTLLTQCGLEVEAMEKWQSVKGGLEGIVIGEVKSCIKHPNADRLSVTTVDIGSGKVLPIVCGAPNVAVGQKVVVATVGTKLYRGEESFVIREANLRGQVSEGMICAEDEIGLGSSHDGILVLDSRAIPGTPASDYFRLETDFVFEIGLTPNRTDAMSHIGVARDIKAALIARNLQAGIHRELKLNLPETGILKPDHDDLDIPVIVENPEACPRYLGLTITNLRVEDSPPWLKNRLLAIGLRPINNVVDITNYILHETGQPLHAFDADEITGKRVYVRKMAKGTRFVTLDGITRKLSEHDLMICNAEEGMCIGGVFGGIKSGVTSKTKNIFLESAYFDPVHIRKTSKYHDLQTDASFRFERGVDPEMTLYALKRAAFLLKEIAGGVISSGIKDVRSKTFSKAKIELHWNHISRLIGKSLDRDTVKGILLALDFEIQHENKTFLNVEVPLYRVDVTREADIIEEILRIYGYNNVEIPERQIISVVHVQKPDPEQTRNLVMDLLSNSGFHEIMNNSLTKAAYFQTEFGFDPSLNIEILNPLSRDLNVMRQSLLFGGLESISHNRNRKNPDLKFYEFGSVYRKNPGIPQESDVTKRFTENFRLALFATGHLEKENWNTIGADVDFFYLKSFVTLLFRRIGCDLSEFRQVPADRYYFEQGLSLVDSKSIVAEIGRLAGSILATFDIDRPVFYADIDWDVAFNKIGQMQTGFRELPKFPEVRRDLALLLDQSVPYSDVENLAFETEKNLLKRVHLFDVYEGQNIEPGKKSYAVGFTLRDDEKTLTDAEIDKVMQNLMAAYINKLNAKIR